MRTRAADMMEGAEASAHSQCEPTPRAWGSRVGFEGGSLARHLILAKSMGKMTFWFLPNPESREPTSISS